MHLEVKVVNGVHVLDSTSCDIPTNSFRVVFSENYFVGRVHIVLSLSLADNICLQICA